MSCPIPQRPWQAVASDRFEVQGEHYAVLVDLYSDYIEVKHLPNMSTQYLIQQMKPIFETHGTPAVLLTDNGIPTTIHRSSNISPNHGKYTTSPQVLTIPNQIEMPNQPSR